MAVRTISTAIKLEGEQEFKRQMGLVNSGLKTLKSEMSLVTAEFSGQANTVDALSAKNRVLRQQYDQQAEKVKLLEKAVREASETYGDADKRTDEYKRQLNYAKIALINLNSELQKNERYLDEAKRSADKAASSIDEYGREVKQAAQESDDADFASPFQGISNAMGSLDNVVGKLGSLKGMLVGGAAVGAVTAGVQAVTGAITEVVDASEEYRKIMGTLEISSQQAGYSAEETAQTYERLYTVLGDTQAAATTTANLQAIGVSQEELMAITDASIGAWARYGDSIPIDGLAEAINETIQAGQVTGVFADVLNWAGASEDDFNAKLAEAKTSTERANIVLQELAQQGLAEAGQAWRTINDDIVAANESQLRLEKAQASLGEQLSPVRDELRELAAGGLEFLSSAVDAASNAMDGLRSAWNWVTGADDRRFVQLADGTWGWVDATEAATEALEDNSEHAVENQEILTDLTEKTKEQQQATAGLTSVEDLLSRALQDQAQKKSLSIDTTLALIDAGYATAIAIDQETGAVTLNKEAYVAIAKAKIDDQIASLETQRTSVQNVLAMKDEAIMATELGRSYYSAAEARTALEGQEASYSAQIAALNQLKKTIGSYKVEVSSAAKSASTYSRQAAERSKKVKTQAEKDLETFRQLSDALDHQRSMDEISEREYYDRLAEYRDKFLTDDANISDYRKVTEQIYKYDKSLAEKESALWEDQTEELADALQDRIDTVLDQQNKMAESLSDYGDLFKIEDDEMSLENIQVQIDAINDYEAAISRLKEREVASGLLETVLGMDVDEAAQYTQELLDLTDEQFESYNALWEEKQKRAKEVAEKFYHDQLDALGNEYTAKLGETLGELTGTAFDSGKDTVQGLIDGLSSKEQALYQKAQKMVDTISGILAEVDVPEVAGTGIDGSHADGLSYVPWDGYIAQLHKGEAVLTADQAAAMRQLASASAPAPTAVTAGELRQVTASAVNALGTIGGPSGGTYKIILQMNVNGKEFYRETIDDFRAVDRERPEVQDDI